jgi:predicted methyltransferase MtxX (methanogen marker protein 4)
MPPHRTFSEQVAILVKEIDNLGKPRIAFGLKEHDDAIVSSLRLSLQWAHISLVTPPNVAPIHGFEMVAGDNPENTLAALLASDQVEGIIRGTLDSFQTIEAYEKLTGERHTLAPSLLQARNGHEFFLEPVSNPEGWTKEERLRIAENLSDFVKKWDVEPLIAVYTGVRHETYARRSGQLHGVIATLNQTYEEADWIVAALSKKGITARNCAIDLNVAIENGFNIHVPVNGMVGNQAFRAFLSGGGCPLAAPRIGLSRVYEDNSRTEKDFNFHVLWTVAQINRHKQSKDIPYLASEARS